MALKISTSTEFAVNEVREFIYSATEYQGNHGIELTSSAYNTVLTLTNRGTLKFAAPATADRSSLIFATASGAWWDGVIRNYGSMSVTGGSVYLLWAGWTPQVINTGRMTADGTDVSLIQGDQVKDQGASYPSIDNSGEMIATGSNGAVGVRFTYASTIINSGKINATVLAGGKNDALALMVGDGSVIRNTGQIVAEDNDAGAARSTAIAFSGSDGPALIVNNGLIKADIAIKESNLPRDFTGYAVSRVENYKDIAGKVVLGLGDDTVINRGQIDGDVELGDQNDVYDGAGGHVTGVVRGGAGVDRFLAGTGSERFEGGAGDDTFAPGTGSAVFDGGAGVDTVDYSSRGSSVSVSLASASVQGGVQLLNVEAVIGSTYGDALTGDDGDNVFQGGGGNDAIDGGAGRDTAVYLGASFEYSWTQGTDGSWTIRDLRAGAADGVDTLRNVELLKFSDKVLQLGIANAINGSAGNDYIRATSADDVIDGGAGVDTVEYRGASTDFTLTQNSDGSWTVKDLRSDHPEGLDFLRNIEQLKFSDKLLVIGSAPPNAINGTSGADYIYATNANDVIDGGAGVDTVEFRGASTDFSWSVGSDGAWTIKDLRSGSPEGTDILRNVEQLKFSDKLVVIVEPTPNVILGTSGSDNLYGTNGNDIIRGGASDDFIYGSDGDDIFDGGEGRDLATFITSQQGVRVDLAILGPQSTGEGSDTFVSIEALQGSAYNDTFYGDSGSNVINGYYGNDQIDGRDGDDSIGGDGGNDIIHGGAGNDSLSGGSGDDAVYGDAGDDRIALASERTGIDPGRDIIDGGDGTDILNVVFVDFGVDINLSISTPQIIGPGIDLVVKNVENLYGWEFADHLTGDARDNVIGGYNGDDVIDGGAGVDTVDMRGASSDYVVTWTVNGWQVADKRAYVASNQLGSGAIYDGVDLVKNVEFIRYYDKTVALGDGMTFVVGNILRDTASTGNAVASGLSARLGSGAMTAAQAVNELVAKAGATTSVATLAYEFFTGKIPGQAGIDYLVSPAGPNPNNLNSAYYQSFNLENRYINFAVNLGKNGEGKDAFTAKYGALTLFDATKAAYKTIFGATPTDEKTHALIDSRADYFAYYGGDGPNGVGAKAAMVGWLLAEAQKADLGVMVRSNDAWLTDLADSSAPFAVDILDPANGYYKADFIFGGA